MRTQYKIISAKTIEELEININNWLTEQQDISVSSFYIMPLLVPPNSMNVIFYASLLYIKEEWK